jgi:RNase H-like domain found in reverse transcriptase
MLETDALDSIIANIYSQKQLDGEWYPITYYLKTMVDIKLNYPIYNKEILAIFSSF